jgi:hypothetical protein
MAVLRSAEAVAQAQGYRLGKPVVHGQLFSYDPLALSAMLNKKWIAVSTVGLK